MKILLIDDDKDDQVLFEEAVNQIADQIECLVADDGLQGLHALCLMEVLPDIVFLDINMPMMNGRETLQAIRSNPKLDTVAVVMYSTSNSERDMKWAVGLNAGYLVKPGDFPSLLSSLKIKLNETLTAGQKQPSACHAL